MGTGKESGMKEYLKRVYLRDNVLQDSKDEGGQVVYITDIADGVLCGHLENSDTQSLQYGIKLKTLISIFLAKQSTSFSALADTLTMSRQLLYYKLDTDSFYRKELAIIKDALKLSDSDFNLILSAK